VRLLIQRVTEASVTVEDTIVVKINKGLLVFFAAHKEDSHKPISWLTQKLLNLRVFPDAEGKMNLSVKDIEGEILVVSQFTLYAQCEKGRRPDFFDTAAPEYAEELYDTFVQQLKEETVKVSTGQFGSHMDVALTNDGPATFLIEK
jgi:D-tyrosyl-tRNA(Tyr) deacylase